METKQEISIRIAANPNASGGYRIIEGHNIIDNSFKENDYSGFSGNPYYFAFSIKEGWVDYCLLRNNVFSHGASRRSPALKIYVSIPKGYALQQKKSPFDLLVDIRNSFLNRCMTNRSDGSYEYKESVNLDFLQDVARNYPLVPYNGPYRPMGGSAKAWTKDSAVACIVVPDETKIRELLGDVQYPEFENYGEIVVATAYDGIQYPVLNNLSIPRPCTYKVYIDGQSKGAITDKSKAYNVDFPVDKRYYVITPVSFTIDGLLSGNKVNGVTIDAQNERVDITVSTFVKPKIHEVKVEVNPMSATKDLLLGRYNLLKIYYNNGGKEKVDFILDDYQTFKLVGTQIGFLNNPQNFNAECLDDRYRINSRSFSEDKKTFVINVTRVSRPNTINTSKGNVAGTGIVSTGLTKSGNSSNLLIDTSNMNGQLTLIYREGQVDKHDKKQGGRYSYKVDVPLKCDKDLKKGNFNKYKPNSSKKYLIIIALIAAAVLGGITGWYLHSSFGDSDASFICSKCDQQFDSQEELADHKELPHCDQCRMAFTDAAGLKEHKDKNHKEYICECGNVFHKGEDLEAHKKREHKYCYLCEEWSIDEDAFKHHIIDKRHKKCDNCDSIFKNDNDLETHKKTHHKEYATVPEKTVTTQDTTNNTTPNPPRRCPFEKCRERFTSVADYVNHIYKTHHQYQCPECPNDRFTDLGGLQRHIKNNHSDKEEKLTKMIDDIIIER